MRTKRTNPIITPHPENYSGLKDLSAIKTSDGEVYYGVHVDQCWEYHKLYNTELARSEQELIDFFELVNHWKLEGKTIPLSIFISKHNLTDNFAHMYQMIDVGDIWHIVGPTCYFDAIGGTENGGKRGWRFGNRPKVKKVIRV